MTNAASWLGRTFGWGGSRGEWIALLGIVAWLAGFAVIGRLAVNWSIGVAVAAFVGWFAVFALVAHNAVRDLFGPVFFYDLIRVSRNKLNFIVRGFYILAIGSTLALWYYMWMDDHTYNYRYGYGHNYSASAQLALFGAITILGVFLLIFYSTRSTWLFSIRILLLIIGLGLTALLGITTIVHAVEALSGRGTSVDLLPSSVISQFATEFFQLYVVVLFIVMALLTPVYVAATISVEKERKTLEFLLATDLRNREIVFGKLASRVLTLMMYVLAGLPLIAFLQLFGGIDPEHVIASTVATLMLVLGLSALSIWVSTTLKKSRDAIMITYLIILAYGFFSFMLAGFANFTGSGWWTETVEIGPWTLGCHDIAAAFADGNPVWGILRIASSGSRNVTTAGVNTVIGDVLREFVVFWSIAILLLLGSSILKIRRTALQQAYGGIARKTLVHPKALGARRKIRDVDSETRDPITLLVDGTRRRPEMGDNPMTWKEVFVDSSGRSGWVGKLLSLLIFVFIFIWPFIIAYQCFYADRMFRMRMTLNEQWHEFNLAINAWTRVATGVVGFLMLIGAALRGAGAISGEKDRDTWISLQSTPISSEELLWGKFWGCVFSLRRAFAALLLIWGVALATNSVRPYMILLSMIMLLIYVSAFSLLGIYCSITARTTLIASVRAFFAGLFCAGGFWAVAGLLCFLPLALMHVRGDTIIETLATFFAALTPPAVLGTAPMNEFQRRDLWVFGEVDAGVALVCVMAGALGWTLFVLLLATSCRAKLMEAMNRSPHRRPNDPPPLPIARAVHRDTPKNAEEPSS